MESLSKITEIFENSTTSLMIPCTFFLETNHLIALKSLFSRPNNIIEFSITGQVLLHEKFQHLCEILQHRPSLKRLILANNNLSDSSSISLLCSVLKSSQIEYLDLSNNQLTDNSIDSLSDLLLTTSLFSLNLDNNLLTKNSLPNLLRRSEKLQYLSLNFNNLSYEFVSDLFSSLTINKSLKSLHLKGLKLEGPAPIKENCSGHLSKREAILLNLAYILRTCNLSTLSIDIHLSLSNQIEELEKTLKKYNNRLISIISEGIDWRNAKSPQLLGISRALSANNWIIKNKSLPKSVKSEITEDIKELVIAKLQSEESMTKSESEEVRDSLQANIIAYSGGTSPISTKQSGSQWNPRKSRYVETPQFTNCVKELNFDIDATNYDKSQGFEDISSIDFEEKRSVNIKTNVEKQLEEIWSVIKKLEANSNSQAEVFQYRLSGIEEKTEGLAKELKENKNVDRSKSDSEDKSIWPALSRIEKFMGNSSKKDFMFEKRVESIEAEMKTNKENLANIINLIEQHKDHVKECFRAKADRKDVENLEKNEVKVMNKLNYINCEIDSLRIESSRVPNRQAEVLNQELAKIREKENKYCEVFKSIESFQSEITAKFEGFQRRFSDFGGADKKRIKNKKEVEALVARNQNIIVDAPKQLKPSSASMEEIRSKTPISTKNLSSESGSSFIEKPNKLKVLKKKILNRSTTPLNKSKNKGEVENAPSVQLQETLRHRGIVYDNKGSLTERRNR